MDFAMPFMIQFVANASAKLKEIDERTKPKEEEETAGQGPATATPLPSGAMLSAAAVMQGDASSNLIAKTRAKFRNQWKILVL